MQRNDRHPSLPSVVCVWILMVSVLPSHTIHASNLFLATKIKSHSNQSCHLNTTLRRIVDIDREQHRGHRSWKRIVGNNVDIDRGHTSWTSIVGTHRGKHRGHASWETTWTSIVGTHRGHRSWERIVGNIVDMHRGKHRGHASWVHVLSMCVRVYVV